MKFVYSLPATKTREKCMYENKWKLEGKKKMWKMYTQKKKNKLNDCPGDCWFLLDFFNKYIL